MSIVIVLITKGKHESVDSAVVKLFGNRTAANDFCKEISTGKTKYWTFAEIVDDGEEVDLYQPEDTL